MIRFMIRVAIFLATSALGLLVASWVLSDFRLSLSGFLTAVIVFGVVQSLLSPIISKLATRFASSLIGLVGLVSTFIALVIATLVSNGLSITGLVTWVFGTLLVWIITMLGAWLLPLLALKKRTT